MIVPDLDRAGRRFAISLGFALVGGFVVAVLMWAGGKS